MGGECNTGCQTAGRGEAFVSRSRKRPGVISTNASPLRPPRATPLVGQKKKAVRKNLKGLEYGG